MHSRSELRVLCEQGVIHTSFANGAAHLQPAADHPCSCQTRSEVKSTFYEISFFYVLFYTELQKM